MSSSPKDIIFEEEARKKLVSGIVKITDAICCTLGPSGRNVGL
jgi:chaperonin GroEL